MESHRTDQLTPVAFCTKIAASLSSLSISSPAAAAAALAAVAHIFYRR